MHNYWNQARPGISKRDKRKHQLRIMAPSLGCLRNWKGPARPFLCCGRHINSTCQVCHSITPTLLCHTVRTLHFRLGTIPQQVRYSLVSRANAVRSVSIPQPSNLNEYTPAAMRERMQSFQTWGPKMWDTRFDLPIGSQRYSRS